MVISGIKESTKANKVDSLLSQLATGIAADLVVLLFYGLAGKNRKQKLARGRKTRDDSSKIRTCGRNEKVFD